MVRETRDLLEDRDGEYPAHVTIRDFQYDGTNIAAVLWLGNENAEAEVDAMLTREDVEWIIRALRQTAGMDEVKQRIANEVSDTIKDALRISESPQGIGDTEITGLALRAAEKLTEFP